MWMEVQDKEEMWLQLQAACCGRGLGRLLEADVVEEVQEVHWSPGLSPEYLPNHQHLLLLIAHCPGQDQSCL